MRSTIIVTGAARGIGEGHAKKLAADGYHVVVADILPTEPVVSDIVSRGGSASSWTLDVSSVDQWETLVSHIDSNLPPLRVSDDSSFITGSEFVVDGGLLSYGVFGRARDEASALSAND